MFKWIRILLVNVFGIKYYVKVVSKIYLCFVKNGFLKNKYPELFYLKKIIKPGFTCIDIGANVGYYSYFMSKYSESSGKVFAVEPIPMFADLWKKNVKSSGFNNLILYNCALGGENKTVKMGIPERNGVIHHGMTKIASTAEEKYVEFIDAEMKIPDELFSNLVALDFVKCDVEGYEYHVFSNMQNTIEKFRPLIQTELSGAENRKKVVTLLRNIGYTPHLLNHDFTLTKVNDTEIEKTEKDIYFVPLNS